jgi:hypothetical protein
MLKEALKTAMYAQKYSPAPRLLDAVINLIQETIALLKAPPRWETPEQWEKRTGSVWPDNAAVYYRVLHVWKKEKKTEWGNWDVLEYEFSKRLAQQRYDVLSNEPGYKNKKLVQIVCATEAGPPSNDWNPEEAEND